MNYLNDPYMINNDHAINRNNCYPHEEEKKNINVDQKKYIYVEQNERINVEECGPQSKNITSRKRYINDNNISGPYHVHNNFDNQYKKPKKNYIHNNFYQKNNNIFSHKQPNDIYHHMNINNIDVSNNSCVMNKIMKSFEKSKQKKNSSHGLYKHVNDTITCLLDNQIYDHNNLYVNTHLFPVCQQNRNDSKKHRNKKHIRNSEYVCNNRLRQNYDNVFSSLTCEDKAINNYMKRSYTLNDKNDTSDYFLNENIFENVNYDNDNYEDSKNHVNNKLINDTYYNINENIKNKTYNNILANHIEGDEENDANIIDTEENIKDIRKYNEEGNMKKRKMDILRKDDILKDAVEYFQNCLSRNNDNINNDSSNEDDIKIKNKYFKENLCYVCKEKEYIYKCPYCEICTCSLECSKNHKKLFKCTQKLKKNLKIKNVTKGNFDESILYKDFLYLQNIATIIQGNYKYIKVKNYETTKIWLCNNKKLFKLLKKRKIILLKAPIYTKIHNENKTFISNYILFWSIKITFVNLNIIVLQHEINENLTFMEIIQYLCSKIEKLQRKIYLYLKNVKSIYISLKNEQPNNIRKHFNNNNHHHHNYINNDNAYDINQYCSVQQILRKSLWGKSFYEYPHFHMEIFFEDDKPIENPLYDIEYKQEDENQHTYQQEERKGNTTDMKEVDADMKEVDTDMKEVDTDMKEVDTDMKEIDTDMKEIDTDMKEIDTDMKEIDTDMKEVDTDMKEVDTDMKEVDTDMKEVDTDMKEVDTDMKEVDTDMKEVDTDMKEVDTDMNNNDYNNM
ncbi:conserved Plasmodium protein, unknown function [Plasmodium sp. gorilla clade G3]|nr:conserved Plasmodium protein, unknown function [Plasmodium sp. gorilla clade G3]